MDLVAWRERVRSFDADEVVAQVVADSTMLLTRLDLEGWRELADAVRQAGRGLPTSFAWRCATGLYQHGDLTGADRVLAEDASAGASAADRAQLAAVRASLGYFRGDSAGCEEQAERAMALARTAADPAAEGVAWVARALHQAMVGDRIANRASYLRGLELARAGRDALLESRILANLGSSLTEEGDFQEAVTWLQEGLLLAETLGGPWRVAMLRLNLADALAGLGRLDEALLEIDLARLLWSSTGSAWEAAAWSSRGALQAARGNLAEAVTALRTATAIAGADGDHQTLVPALAGLARVVAAEDPAEAAALVDRLLTLPVAQGRVEVRLAAGWVALHAGRADEAARYGDGAHAEALERRDRPGRADALLLIALATQDAARAHAAVVLWDELGSAIQRTVAELVHAHLAGDPLGRLTARDELRQLGVHDDAWRAAGPLHAVRRALPDAPVVIHTLGSFVVYRDGVAAGAGDWPSAEAPALLRTLVVAGSAAAEPDVVEELRSVLDPEGARPADAFVGHDGSTALLRTDRVRLDVADFLHAARVALEGVATNRPEAPRMLRSAASLYTGDFLEDAVGDAAESLREEVAVLGHDVNRALADLLAAGSNPADAVPWLARILITRPDDERAAADLVRVLSASGDLVAARRHYDAYVWRCRLAGVRARPQEELLAPVAG